MICYGTVYIWNVNSVITNHCWKEGDHKMDFENSKIVYKSNIVKIRRLIEGVLIDSIPTIEGNKSFSKADSINLKTIVNEAKLADLIKQKNEFFNHVPFDPAIPQNDIPDPPGIDPLAFNEERGLGRRLILVDGWYLRRSHRLNASQSFENGDRGH